MYQSDALQSLVRLVECIIPTDYCLLLYLQTHAEHVYTGRLRYCWRFPLFGRSRSNQGTICLNTIWHVVPQAVLELIIASYAEGSLSWI